MHCAYATPSSGTLRNHIATMHPEALPPHFQSTLIQTVYPSKELKWIRITNTDSIEHEPANGDAPVVNVLLADVMAAQPRFVRTLPEENVITNGLFEYMMRWKRHFHDVDIHEVEQFLKPDDSFEYLLNASIELLNDCHTNIVSTPYQYRVRLGGGEG